MLIRLLLGLIPALGLMSCTTLDPQGSQEESESHLAFRSTPGWQQQAFFVDEAGLALTTTENSRVLINLGEQRALLYRDDAEGSTVVIDTQVATGKPGFSTPSGSFTILSKKRSHHSNLYGNYVDANGNVVVSDVDTRKSDPPEGTTYQGASMPYWQRLTNRGVGMHVGYVPGGRAASHGCIRFPAAIMPRIYERTKVGTSVKIVHSHSFPNYPAQQLAAGQAGLQNASPRDGDSEMDGEGGLFDDEEDDAPAAPGSRRSWFPF